MTDSTTYSPRKRVLLQVAMWVLLVATVGAAVLLINLKKGLWRVDLADAQTFGALEMRLPRNWKVEHQEHGGFDTIQVVEPRAPGRALNIRNVNFGDETPRLPREDGRLVEEISVRDGEGVIIHSRRGRGAFALLSFNNGQVVLVQMISRSANTASDDAILYNVATSIRLAPGAPKPPSQTPSSPLDLLLPEDDDPHGGDI